MAQIANLVFSNTQNHRLSFTDNVIRMYGNVRVPMGATTVRPPIENGLLRYNETTNRYEGVENNVWVDLRSSDASSIPVGNTLPNGMFQLRSSQSKLNFITGAGVTLTIVDDVIGGRANISMSISAGDPAFAYAQANAGITTANQAFDAANGAFASANAGQATANAAFARANAAITTANQAFNAGNASFSLANSTVITLTQAFNAANTAQTGPLIVNTQTASYILAMVDRAAIVEMNVGSSNNLTVPPNSDVAFPVGTLINIVQIGAGQTTLNPGIGVTINSYGGKLKLTGQYSMATLYKRATDTWQAGGDLST